MAPTDDRAAAVARVYARAMLALALDKDAADELLDELGGLVQLLDNYPGLEDYLTKSVVGTGARAKEIERLFRGKLSDLAADSLQVICRKGRLALLRSIAEAYRLALEEHRGEVDVHVETAVPLSQDLRTRLKAIAAEYTGKQVQLIEEVNETLIGGLVLRVGDQKIDASVVTSLERLHESLLERASREIHAARTLPVTSDE